MRLFKFYEGHHYYGICANTQFEAEKILQEYCGPVEVDNVEEIPPENWKDVEVNMYEDNDFESEPYKIPVTELMTESPNFLFSNDYAVLDP